MRTKGLDVGAGKAWEAEALRESWREVGREGELRVCDEVVADFRAG